MTLILKSTGLTADLKNGSGGAVYGVKKVPYQSLDDTRKPKPKLAPVTRKLAGGVLRHCMKLIYQDPSGEACTAYLEMQYSTRSIIDRYFFEAERLVWHVPDNNNKFLDSIKLEIAEKQARVEARAAEALARVRLRKKERRA